MANILSRNGTARAGFTFEMQFRSISRFSHFPCLDLGTVENCIIHDCGANPVSIGWAGIQPLSVTPWPRYRNGRQGRTDMRNKWSGRPLAARGRRPTAANSATAREIGMRVHSVSWQAMTALWWHWHAVAVYVTCGVLPERSDIN